MDNRALMLVRTIAEIEAARRPIYRATLSRDAVLQRLVSDLVTARTAAGMTQEEVAARMWTKKSVVSRLESGTGTRPTLRTIERYALAVGAELHIRVRPYRRGRQPWSET